MHLVLRPREASSPPARPQSSERGGRVSGRSSVARERASVSSAPSGAAERGVARSQRTPPACSGSSVVSPHSSQHAPRCDELGEASVDHSRSRSSHVFRSSDRGTWKDCRARSRSDSSCDCDRRSRSRSAYRSWLSGRERRRRSSSRSLSYRERSRSSDRSRSRRDLRIAPAPVAFALTLGETALGVTGHGLLTATDHVGSVHVPLLAGKVIVTARGQAISLVILVTARGHADDLLPPLTIRGQRREDGEPDMSGRRVWRR